MKLHAVFGFRDLSQCSQFKNGCREKLLIEICADVSRSVNFHYETSEFSFSVNQIFFSIKKTSGLLKLQVLGHSFRGLGTQKMNFFYMKSQVFDDSRTLGIREFLQIRQSFNELMDQESQVSEEVCSFCGAEDSSLHFFLVCPALVRPRAALLQVEQHPVLASCSSSSVEQQPVLATCCSSSGRTTACAGLVRLFFMLNSLCWPRAALLQV